VKVKGPFSVSVGSRHEANIRFGLKTVHVVFKYLSMGAGGGTPTTLLPHPYVDISLKDDAAVILLRDPFWLPTPLSSSFNMGAQRSYVQYITLVFTHAD
jgi:hypothetical protein